MSVVPNSKALSSRNLRIDENTRAASVQLSADDIADLNTLTDRVTVHGNRYNDLHMSLIGR